MVARSIMSAWAVYALFSPFSFYSHYAEHKVHDWLFVWVFVWLITCRYKTKWPLISCLQHCRVSGAARGRDRINIYQLFFETVYYKVQVRHIASPDCILDCHRFAFIPIRFTSSQKMKKWKRCSYFDLEDPVQYCSRHALPDNRIATLFTTVG